MLATVWDLAKSGRKGDPPGLTKPEFERAACLVSFGIHESVSLLKTPRDAGGASFANATRKKTTSREAKRLRYAIAGMFWKFEAFDVRPVESMSGRPLVAREHEPTKSDVSDVVSDVRAVAKPLVAPIALRVPTTGRRKKNQASDATMRRDTSSSSDEEASSSKLRDRDGSHAASNWEARFPEEEDPEKEEKSRETPNAPKPSVAETDPFADLVAALSSAPSTPMKSVASTSSFFRSAEAKAVAELKRTPHLLDEVPGVDVDVDVDVSFDRMRLEDAPEEKNAPPADLAFAFETLRGAEAFAFDFSGHAFQTGAAETGAVADEAVDEDEDEDEDDAPIFKKNRADDDVLGGVARGSPEETETPFFFDDGFAREKSAFEDDFSGDDFPGAFFSSSPRSPRRPARDPEMEEWSAACRAWPWLAGEARAEERRDEEEPEVKAGWAAF